MGKLQFQHRTDGRGWILFPVCVFRFPIMIFCSGFYPLWRMEGWWEKWFFVCLIFKSIKGNAFCLFFLYLFPNPCHFSLACRQEVSDRELCLLMSKKGRGQSLSLSLFEAGSVPGLMEGWWIIATSRVLGPNSPWTDFRHWATRESSSYPNCPSILQPADILNRLNCYPTCSWRIKLWNVMLEFYGLAVFVMHCGLQKTQCWQPNYQFLGMQPYLEIRLKAKSSGWILIQYEIWAGSRLWEERWWEWPPRQRIRVMLPQARDAGDSQQHDEARGSLP